MDVYKRVLIERQDKTNRRGPMRAFFKDVWGSQEDFFNYIQFGQVIVSQDEFFKLYPIRFWLRVIVVCVRAFAPGRARVPDQ